MAVQVPTPFQDPKTWQTLSIAGVKMPGVIQRVRLSGALVLSREGIPGANGAIFPDPRWSEEGMEFEMKIWTAEDMQAVQRLRQAYKNPGTGDKVKPVPVEHPLLKLWQISSMIVESIELEWTIQFSNIIMYTVKLTNNRPKVAKGSAVVAPGGTNKDGTVKPVTPATLSTSNEIDPKATNTPAKPSQGPPK